MFEIYDTKGGKNATSHPVVAPLVQTLKQCLAVFSLDPNMGKETSNNSKAFTLSNLMGSPAFRDGLKHQKGSEKTVASFPAFFDTVNSLKALPATPDVYKAIVDIMADSRKQYDVINAHESALTNDIKEAQTMIESFQEQIPLALANGDIDQVQEMESRIENLNASIKTFTFKREALDGSSRFILSGLLYILAIAETEIIKAFRKKRAAELIPAYEKAKAAFLSSCREIKAYAPDMLIIDGGYNYLGHKEQPQYGELWKELIKDVSEIPAHHVDAKSELLRAA